MCRSRRELSNEHLLAKIGVDTAENELLQVLFNIIQYYSIVSLDLARSLEPPRAVERGLGRGEAPVAGRHPHREDHLWGGGCGCGGSVIRIVICNNRERANFTELVLGCIEADF